MNDDFDELDRALFALPLEAPPAGMRETILRSTVYAPVAAPLAFARWEIAGIGAALALAVWLVLVAVVNHAFAVAFAADCYELALGLANPATLAWLATGGSVALIASLATFTLPRQPVRNGRNGRS